MTHAYLDHGIISTFLNKTRHSFSTQRHIQWHWLDCYLSFRPSTVTEVYPYEDFSGVTWNLARISLTWKYEWGTPWFSFRVFRTIFKIFKRMNMVRTMWSRFTTVGCWPVTDWPNVTWHQIVLSHMCTLRREKKPGKIENSYHNSPLINYDYELPL